MNLRALLTIACAIIAIWPAPSQAQEPPSEWSGGGPPKPAPEPPDVVFMKLLTEGKLGLAVIGATGPSCDWGTINVGRAGDSKPNAIAFSKYGGIGRLEPGQYAVLSVKCRSTWDNNTTALNGPFATFSVRAGEMVDVGVLKLEYRLEALGAGRNGALHKTIMSISPDTIARLKERIPRSSARMINRPMVMVGAADTPIHRQPSALERLIDTVTH